MCMLISAYAGVLNEFFLELTNAVEIVEGFFVMLTEYI